jgi:hypothetical protein
MMMAFKLLRRRKRDGTLGPLFINKKMVIPIGEWLQAECFPTKGFAVRSGFHVLARVHAPHLMRKDGTLAPDRVWAKVEIEGFEEFHRPESQGGKWYLARRMRVLETL